MREPRMIFGFCLLVVVCAVIIVIALGHVQKETSYGLDVVLIMLSPLSNKWADWAFGSKEKEK